MMSQTGQQMITINILPKISISKNKFGHLVEYKMKYFFEKLYKECGGEASPGLFNKKLKLIIALDQQCEML